MNDIIIIENLTKRFKDATVLKNINLSFEKGKIYGLIGRNGSGKTMLLKSICGFVPATEGRIIVEDKIIGKDIDIPDNLGAIIEAPGFLPNYNAYNNLRFLSVIKNKISKEEIFDVIRTVGLDPNSKKHVGKFSLGMRQRLGIAQAIMEDPEILILDEPMNGVDNAGVSDIRSILLTLKEKGKTIILASHSKEDIQILCDVVVEMDQGEVVSIL